MLAYTVQNCIVNTGSDPFPPTKRPQNSTRLDDHLACGVLRGIESKSHVFCEGDPKAFVYKVITGAVCLYTVLGNGRRQVIDFAYPGDVLGLGMGSVEMFSAQATTATRLKCMPAAALQSAATRDPQFALQLYEAVLQELASAREHLVSVGQHSATERLVTFLLDLSDRNGARGGEFTVVELPMSRTDIGDFLGMTVETVSRTFTKLRLRGLIEIDQGTAIRIVDPMQLKTLADSGAGR